MLKTIASKKLYWRPAIWTAPPLEVANGSLAGLKWLALLLMSGDHVNKYLFNSTLPCLYEAGRLAMPLFAFVLAYNLSRTDALNRGIYARVMQRLWLFGAVATPPFIALGGLYADWLPLNILFTLLGMAGVLRCMEQRSISGTLFAAALFLSAGSIVEFGWIPLAFGVSVWAYRRSPSWSVALVGLAFLGGLYIINKNFWALAALVPICLAAVTPLRLPRVRWAFYVFYPLHLWLLLAARMPMRRAGYLFF